MDIFELSEENRLQVVAKLNHFYQQDQYAVKMAVELLFIGHLWDDLVDRDKVRTDEDINNAFTIALGELPINPYFPAVYHMIRNAICQWECANAIAGESPDTNLTSFLIRNALLEIVHYLIFLVGGPAWMKEQGADFWRFFGQGMAKQYDGFLKEVKHA
jgi:hypothetical protein